MKSIEGGASQKDRIKGQAPGKKMLDLEVFQKCFLGSIREAKSVSNQVKSLTRQKRGREGNKTSPDHQLLNFFTEITNTHGKVKCIKDQLKEISNLDPSQVQYHYYPKWD